MPRHRSLFASSTPLTTLLRQCFGVLSVFTLLANATDPAPLAVPVGTDFFGYDGLWSGVNIRVGGPESQAQYLTVLPFTGSQETWVIGPGGCDGTSTCAQLRGGVFYKNQSQTWDEQGYYELGLDTNLGDTDSADYGLDQISLYDQSFLPSQVVGIINTTDFWLGALGLGVAQTRFGGTTNHLTFLSTLVENASQIPSHSYGYTAGAYYQLKTVPSSLTLGGVDTNRFVPNHASFTLSPHQAPVVSINQISVGCTPLESAASYPNWSSNPLSILDSSAAVYATIDSSTPFLWLPEAVCDNFAAALNLTYNDTLGLYLFQEGLTTPDILQQWNMTFTFSISDYPGSNNKADLAISYNAFNLQLSYPFPKLDANFTSPPTSYFPLRKAANDAQITIGRAFLQETYLTVDYERNNFSVSQATFTLDALTNTNLVAITRPANSNYTGPFEPSSSTLTSGAKVGIGAGAAVLVVCLVAGLLYFCVYKKRGSQSKSSEKGGGNNNHRRSLLSRLGMGSSRASSEQGASELLGDKRQPAEVSADSSNSRFELPASAPAEMPAGEVPISFYATNQDGTMLTGSSRNDPRNPAELEQRDSMEKNGLAIEREPTPVPPAYSAAEIGQTKAQRISNSISPNSPRNSHGFGTLSSGEQGISPVGPDRSSGSSQKSRSPLSPVSPNETRFPHLHTGRTDTSNSGSNRSLLTPYTHVQSSRFTEEGLDSDSEATQSATRPPLTARFSWEE